MAEQINALTAKERACFDRLKSNWERKCQKVNNNININDGDDQKKLALYSDEMLLRFARNSPNKPFHDKGAWKVMKKYNESRQRFDALDVSAVEAHLLSCKLVFPLPLVRCKSSSGNEYYENVAYLRPSRHAVQQTPASVAIDSMAYVLNAMVEKEVVCTHGVVLLVNLHDFTMANFSADYWYQFLCLLQSNNIPIRVRVLLFVNPPSFFTTSIWNITKTMLEPYFLSRVKILKRSDTKTQLDRYLAPGFEAFLPDDDIFMPMPPIGADSSGGKDDSRDGAGNGGVSTEQLVQDFVTYRKSVESLHRKQRHAQSLAVHLKLKEKRRRAEVVAAHVQQKQKRLELAQNLAAFLAQKRLEEQQQQVQPSQKDGQQGQQPPQEPSPSSGTAEKSIKASKSSSSSSRTTSATTNSSVSRKKSTSTAATTATSLSSRFSRASTTTTTTTRSGRRKGAASSSSPSTAPTTSSSTTTTIDKREKRTAKKIKKKLFLPGHLHLFVSKHNSKKESTCGRTTCSADDASLDMSVSSECSSFSSSTAAAARRHRSQGQQKQGGNRFDGGGGGGERHQQHQKQQSQQASYPNLLYNNDEDESADEAEQDAELTISACFNTSSSSIHVPILHSSVTSSLSAGSSSYASLNSSLLDIM
jgi:CRAL/TRIO domain